MLLKYARLCGECPTDAGVAAELVAIDYICGQSQRCNAGKCGRTALTREGFLDVVLQEDADSAEADVVA